MYCVSKIDRTFDLIELLARRGALGMRPIARELDVPIGSLHRLLNDLAAQAVLERTADGEWQLSYRLLQIVGIQLERTNLPRLARPYLEQLAAETRETVFLAVPSHGEIVYLDKVQTDLQLQLNVELGTRRPMYATGLGKAILAFLPEVEREQFLAAEPFPAFTEQTITTAAVLGATLEEIRERGYALDQEEMIPGLHCIAVPVLNYTNHAVGAVSVAGVATRAGGARFNALTERLLGVGRELSLRLGYVPPELTGKDNSQVEIDSRLNVG
jgi:IclR family acetate operon transcriptional repressor